MKIVCITNSPGINTGFFRGRGGFKRVVAYPN